MIATGISHVLALDTAGNVYAWGSNNSGQLGIELSGDASIENKSKKGGQQAQMGDGDEASGGFSSKPQQLSGDIKDYEVCQIFAGKK